MDEMISFFNKWVDLIDDNPVTDDMYKKSMESIGFVDVCINKDKTFNATINGVRYENLYHILPDIESIDDENSINIEFSINFTDIV